MSLLKHSMRVIAGQSPAGEDVTDLAHGTPFLQGKAEFGPTYPQPRYECATATKIAPHGSILVSVRAPVGAVNVADRAYGIGRGLAAVVPDLSSGSYVRYLLESQASFLRSLATGSTFEAVTAADIGRIKIPVESLGQQRAIADYLDRETAKIDTLIEKQTTMIERLRERRDAVVHRGVTQGADPAHLIPASTWTGTRPEGWSSLRVSWIVNRTGSGTTPPNEEIQLFAEGLIPWVNTSELRERPIRNVLRGVTTETLHATSALRIHPAGTVLIAMYGATIGRLGWLEVPATTNQACLALIGTRRGFSSRFLVYALLAARNELILRASGGGQPNINADKVRALRIPTPPAAEQREIADYLDRETAKIDTLIAKVERHIELAKERRAALITAAVPGQIDVSGENVA